MSLRGESEFAVAPAAADRSARRERLAVSGGHLLRAAVQFLGELLPVPSDSPESKAATTALATTLKQNLTHLVEQDHPGRPPPTFPLPTPPPPAVPTNLPPRLLAL